MSKSVFIRTYASLPDSIRKEVIAVVEQKPYSWDAAYVEVIKDTSLGKAILEKLERMGLIQDG
jgi:hypothetical protein